MNLLAQIAQITRLAEKVLKGATLTFEEACLLLTTPDEVTPFLLGAADVIRKHFRGRKVDRCAIVNARSGRCPEDCRFCAQARS
ncbi:biotin synthase BioB, partial [Desulforudis sp. 1190]